MLAARVLRHAGKPARLAMPQPRSAKVLRNLVPASRRMSTTVEAPPAAAPAAAPVDEPAPAEAEGGIVSRFTYTVEVIVSKIFPAGFGWQAASCVAGAQGFEADTLNFYLTTGAGDVSLLLPRRKSAAPGAECLMRSPGPRACVCTPHALPAPPVLAKLVLPLLLTPGILFQILRLAPQFAGVLAGHSLFSIAKAAMGKGGGLGSDLVGGLWLATAAFCSGTAWQPVVNFLHDTAGCNFVQTAVGCGMATGGAFFVGLRLGRIIYAPLGLPAQDYDNLGADAYLSVSIGAATGTFVGTDVTFADNVIRPAFGVEDNMTDLEGMVRAGMSTSTGFLCMQSIQNVVRASPYPDPPPRAPT